MKSSKDRRPLRRRTPLWFTATLLGTVGCKDPVLRTGILIQLTAQNPSAVRNNVDRIYVVIDPEEPFTDNGELYEDGAELSSSVTMQNWLTDDDDLELVYELTALGTGNAFPAIELRQGANKSAFTVQASGWFEDTETVGSEVEGPLNFVNKTVPEHSAKW